MGEGIPKAHQRIKKWPFLAIVAAMVMASLLFVVLLLATHLAEQITKSLVESNMDTVYSRLTDRANILLHVNESAFALANAIRISNISSFSEMEKKIAPRLFTAFSTIQLVSHVSYISNNGFVFSYHRENQTNMLFSLNFNSCHFYNQNIDKYSGERRGYPVALSYQQCSAAKGWFLDALNWQVGSAKIKNQTIFFTAQVGNFGVVSVGVDLKHFLRHVSAVGLDQSYFFITINGSSSRSQFLVSLKKNIDSLSNTDSRNLLSGAEVVKHLHSTEGSSIQIIKIPGVPMLDDQYQHLLNKEVSYSGTSHECQLSTNYSRSNVRIRKFSEVITLTFKDEKMKKVFQVLKVVIICLAGILFFGMALFTFLVLQRLKQSKIQLTILNAELIKQKEAVKQAERKSMNKSMAVARASHDVRNALHSIIGLIDFCQDQTTSSDLGTDLAKMKDYARDLLDLLNSILDNSKVESGKMHLEQAEFNIFQIIETSVDSFNVLAEKKGLEMIWDPCDFSILKLEKVIGDKQRFKQILDNLLGNAVKFTSEGKIIVRAWASEPNLKIPSVSSYYGCSISQMFCFLKKSVLRIWRSKNKHQDVNYVQNDPYSIELTFEVDDSGIGIPIEKRASVFENYVQVEEDSPEGTGLGLGIVQSLVRLMGGEINIIDKQPGENGTCFKFNIFLKSGEVAFQETIRNNEANRSTISEPFILNESHSRKVHSLLFVQGCETKRILQTWIEGLGIKVWTAKQAEQISSTLEKIKHSINSSSKSDSVMLCKTFSRKIDNVENEEFLRNRERNSEPLPRTELSSDLPLRILIIVDLSIGNLPEILSTLIDFAGRNTNLYCKIACIADSKVSENSWSQLSRVLCDLTLRKPIHGSRLQKLFELIQELEKTEELFVDRTPTNPLPELPMHKQPIENQITAESRNLKRVLLVDDNDVMREILIRDFKKRGAIVKVAKNGYEALDLVKEALETGFTRGENDRNSFVFDAIFMDCGMPVMDGYEAARQIRKEESQYRVHIPIIAMSADVSDEVIQNANAAGMDHVLLKPLDKSKVTDLFKTIGT